MFEILFKFSQLAFLYLGTSVRVRVRFVGFTSSSAIGQSWSEIPGAMETFSTLAGSDIFNKWHNVTKADIVVGPVATFTTQLCPFTL